MTINAQLCGMIGGAGLIVAAFAPVVSLPIVGGLSPFALHWAAGVALLVIGGAAVVAGLTEKPRAVGLTGIVSALYVAAGVIFLSDEVSAVFGNDDARGLIEGPIESVERHRRRSRSRCSCRSPPGVRELYR